MTIRTFVIAALSFCLFAMPVSAGMLQLTTAGGWAGQGAKLDIQNDADCWAALQDAAANGGTISYDIVINESEQTYTCPPDWFQTVSIFNSGGAVGGWDQEVISYGINPTDWPLVGGTRTETFSASILSGAPAGDGDHQADVSGGWTQLYIGTNNGDNAGAGCMTESVINIDNITITGNGGLSHTITFDSDLEGFVPDANTGTLAWVPVPEPSSVILVMTLLAGLGIFRRR